MKIQYHYDFFPKSIFPRFLVKVHKFIKDDLYWRNGVVLEKIYADIDANYTKESRNRARIISDEKEKKIFVSIIGDQDSQRYMLNDIRNYFDLLHDDLKELGPKTIVVYDKNPLITEDYHHLLILEQNGVREFIPHGLNYKVNTNKFLKNIRREQDLNTFKRDSADYKAVLLVQAKKLNFLKSEKDILDKKAIAESKKHKIGLYLFLVIIILLLGYFTVTNWNKWEGYVSIGLICLSLLLAYLQVSYTPDYFHKKILERKKTEYYQLGKFDIEDYKELKKAVKKIEVRAN